MSNNGTCPKCGHKTEVRGFETPVIFCSNCDWRQDFTRKSPQEDIT